MRRFLLVLARIIPAVMLVAVVSATGGRPAAASEVVDDAELARRFVAGLEQIVEAGDAAAAPLGSQAAAEQLAAAEGRRVRVPPAATPCSLGPDRSLYDTVRPAVVIVGSIYQCGKCNDWHLGGLASGWIVSDMGLVVTNHHVFGREPSHRFGVMTAAGEVHAVTEVLAGDAAGDAAVVRIDTRGRRMPFLLLGREPDCGDAVTVISHPTGRFYCLTEGVVSRFHRQPVAGEASASAVWMSVTADYALGSSGGPVFDTAGEVVGMVSRTFSSRRRRGKPDPSPSAPTEQMVFKDCVSLETLRRLIDDAS